MSVALVLAVMAAGGVAGCLGALLGIGGGVFLVPFLNVVLGLPFKMAAAISLMTVVATSSVVSAGTAGRSLINLRLGMLLEIASTVGGLAAGITVDRLSNSTLSLMFAFVTAAIAVLMISRLERRNVLPPGVDPGWLGGRFHEQESGGEVVYQIKRLPVGLGAALVAGSVSGALGIGGGILKVPVLNAWCGVPMRAAAATSALMIGVTAVSSVPIQYARGYVDPPMAAAAVLGVLAGSRAGFWFGGRARAKWLKMVMAAVLISVSVLYLLRALR
ncbi:MAG TPA: sulfite exporter TauE/SafE family protein [Vicinamibacterales bacterium]|nr:sulfite exporter TauE/SafE family protein [Vicinamibacterales bacterium]